MPPDYPNYPAVPSAEPSSTRPSAESVKAAASVLAESTIASKVAILLDSALDQLALQIAKGEITSAMLGELVKLAKASGVDLARAGQPMSAAAARTHDALLASLDDLKLPQGDLN